MQQQNGTQNCLKCLLSRLCLFGEGQRESKVKKKMEKHLPHEEQRRALSGRASKGKSSLEKRSNRHRKEVE